MSEYGNGFIVSNLCSATQYQGFFDWMKGVPLNFFFQDYQRIVFPAQYKGFYQSENGHILTNNKNNYFPIGPITSEKATEMLR